MNNILARRHRELLEQFAWSNVLIAFDYDGTLAPMVSDPAHATIRPVTHALLAKVARLYPCIVISGRSQADVLRRLRGIRVLEVIGNHGAEPWRAHNGTRRTVGRWHKALAKHLGHLKGVEIENKHYSLAVHYRRSREKKQARAAILGAISHLAAVRVIGGEQVINVVPREAPHKGMALERERKRKHCDTAVYVGDDETDEDVFMLDRPGRLLTIRVGAKRSSRASYCIRNQRQIDQLLRTLVALRRSGHRVEEETA